MIFLVLLNQSRYRKITILILSSAFGIVLSAFSTTRQAYCLASAVVFNHRERQPPMDAECLCFLGSRCEAATLLCFSLHNPSLIPHNFPMLLSEITIPPAIAATLILGLLALAIWSLRRIRGLVRELRTKREQLDHPFTSSEREVLDRNFPAWRKIPRSLLPRHLLMTRALIEAKNYEACGGLPEVTEEMKLTIAAQAAMTMMGRDYYNFLPRLRSILVYPAGFRDLGRRRFGINEEERDLLSGESWDTGSVILSWKNTLLGGRGQDGGMNVVIHEFAHQIDRYNGVTDGVPRLAKRNNYATWVSVMKREYEALVAATENKDSDPFLDPYGATHPAEFFAVISETFFTNAGRLKQNHPELYTQLQEFYGLDPADWI